jgi:multidrug efflux system membrane fusion protein
MSTVKYFIVIVFLALTIAGCSSGSKDKYGAAKAVPVTAAVALQKNVPLQLSAIGNVEAFKIVSVRARIGGELEKVYFSEGDYVQEGDLLFLIDPRPYEAALKQAEANLARDSVQAANAEKDAQRYAALVQQGIVTKEQYEQMRTSADALHATVKAERAALENAGLQLDYCKIKSPITGLTGKLMFDRGNMIKANDDKPLVVINQIQPIYVSFSVPEKEFPAIKKYQGERKLKAEAFIPGSKTAPPAGELTFINNTVDTSTGTILLKATFANADRTLWPGQFVNVVLTLGIQSGAVVIPSQAVQSGQSGSYVFVIKNDRTAEMRMVEAGRAANGELVIEKGVEAGETVVTDGQLQLSTGTNVEIKNPGQTERQGS